MPTSSPWEARGMATTACSTAISRAISRPATSVARAWASSIWIRRPSVMSQRGSPLSAERLTESTRCGARPREARTRYWRCSSSARRMAHRLGRASSETASRNRSSTRGRSKPAARALANSRATCVRSRAEASGAASVSSVNVPRATGRRAVRRAATSCRRSSFSSAWRSTPRRCGVVKGWRRAKSAPSTASSSSAVSPSAGSMHTMTAVGRSWRALAMKLSRSPDGLATCFRIRSTSVSRRVRRASSSVREGKIEQSLRTRSKRAPSASSSETRRTVLTRALGCGWPPARETRW